MPLTPSTSIFLPIYLLIGLVLAKVENLLDNLLSIHLQTKAIEWLTIIDLKRALWKAFYVLIY